MSTEEIHLLSGTYRQVADVLGWEKAYEFGRAVWEKPRSPSRQNSDKGRGGAIYVPKAISKRTGEALLKLLSAEDAQLLAEKFGGAQLEFGKPPHIGPSRDEAIAQTVRDGWSLQHVSELFGLNEKTIREVCKKRGVISKELRGTVAAMKAERREGVRLAVLQAYQAGACICSAAYTWGFAPDMADAIVHESAVPGASERGSCAAAPDGVSVNRPAPHGLRASLCACHA